MKIIGEKINGTLSLVKKAVEEKDASFIQDLARRQADAGALDLAITRFAPDLIEDLDGLGDPGGAHRVPLGLEAAAGVDRDAAAQRR